MFETTTALKCWSMPEDADDCLRAILAAIERATASLRVTAFDYRHVAIHEALKVARTRGVAVRIIADHLLSCGVAQRALLQDFVSDGGSPDHVCICTSTQHQFMHQKSIAADVECCAAPDRQFGSVEEAWGQYPWVMSGSLNYTRTSFQQTNVWQCMPGKLAARDFAARFDTLFAWGKAHQLQFQLGAPA